VQRFRELLTKVAVIERCGFCLHVHDVPQARLSDFHLVENSLASAPQAIALHSVTNFCGDDNPNARVFERKCFLAWRRENKNGEIFGCDRAPAPKNESKIMPPAQAHIRAHAFVLVGCKSLASFASSRGENSPTTFGRHARLKAMIAFAPAIVRLIRAFHARTPYRKCGRTTPGAKTTAHYKRKLGARQPFHDFMGVCAARSKKAGHTCLKIEAARLLAKEPGERAFGHHSRRHEAVDKRCMKGCPWRLLFCCQTLLA
jgi:ribosomal protein L34E